MWLKLSTPDCDADVEENVYSTAPPADQSVVTVLMLPALVQSPKIKSKLHTINKSLNFEAFSKNI
jgi:hypothetical protein